MKNRLLLVSVQLIMCLVFFSKNTYAGEGSLYDFLWLDPDKKVYVLQNKQFKKQNNFYLDLGYLTGITSKFQDSSGIAASASYYFHEEWGIELGYAAYSNNNNGEFKNISSVNDIEPFSRKINSTKSVLVKWAPFYGKINTFNKIIYFDLMLGAGVSMLETQANVGIKKSSPRVKDISENYTGGVTKVEVKVYITKNWNVGTYLQTLYYNAPGPKVINETKLYFNNDFVFYGGYSF